MLDEDYIAQQSQAGPSRPTREVVPTSDDEDIFFVSQSSDQPASSLGSARSPRRSQNDGAQQDDEDDQEVILPTRHTPTRSGPNPNTDSFAVDPPPPTATGATIAIEEPDLLPPIQRSLLPPTTPPNPHQSSPPSISGTPNLSQHHHNTSPNDVDSSSPPTPGDTVEDNAESPLDHAQGTVATESDADITLRRGSNALPSSQQSDATLPFAESPTASQQDPRPLSPVLLFDTSPTNVGSQQAARQLISGHGQHLSPRPRGRMDSDDDVASLAIGRASTTASGTAEDSHSARRASPVASSPPLLPLRIPSRVNAPQSFSEMPDPPVTTATQSNNDATLNDEHLARAAAARPPTPPRRQLRQRKAAQLNPYTLEAARYQRALIRNDWEDAVVSQMEWHRQERRRLAEEAARAQRDTAGAQGSEESQSQWLVPSSDPSSQGDHEDFSAPSSPPVQTMPEVFVEIPALGDADSTRRYAGGARPGPPSPTPSQSGRLPDLAEMLAARNASLNRNSDRSVSSRHATYKGPRTHAHADTDGKTAQPQVSEDSQVNEDESIPLPPLTRRKHPPRALSPLDNDDPQIETQSRPSHADTFIVESSEDERPAPVPPVSKPKRRSRWSGDGSSSDSTDYERRFRQLKKMMPAGMARKHIRDLRAMRHGKAYHSDGHTSSSSSDGADRTTTTRPRVQSAATAQASDNEELQPGQTRKRLRRHDSLDGNNALLLDPDSDSSSSSASSLASAASVSFTYANLAGSPEDAGDHKQHEEEEEDFDERPAQWWSVNRLDSHVPYRERDAIDRMLSRTDGRHLSGRSRARAAKTSSHHRQARLDGFVSTHRHRERTSDPTRSHLKEIDQNHRRQERTTKDQSGKDAKPPISSRKKKRRKLDPRVGRTAGSGARGASGPLLNPPVVRPRARPRLDLEQHEVLFAADPARTRYAGPRTNPADASRDDELSSNDDSQWQILSHALRDTTPMTIPDARLAAPRGCIGIAAQSGPSLAAVHDNASSPARDTRSSPSMSAASAGLARLHAVNVHSPDAPTRTRPNAFLQKTHVRTVAGHGSALNPSAAPDPICSDAWDDFEGISLDFGFSPLAEGKRLKVTNSSLMARFPDLLALPDRLLHHEHVPRTWSGDVLRLEDTVLDIDMDHDDLATKLPFYIDNLRLMISRALDGGGDDSSIDTRRHATRLVTDTGAFLGCWIVRQAQSASERRIDAASIFRSYRTILERLEQLQGTVLSVHELAQPAKASREERKWMCLQLAWIRFELCWRAMAICEADARFALEPEAPTVESLLTYGRTVISLLLHHGLHRCVRNVRRAAAASSSAEADLDEPVVDMEQDDAAEASLGEATAMWLGVMHLIDSFEKGRGILDGRLFWTQFETAFQRWDESMPKRAPLLRSESLWYSLLALESLSQISPSAQTQFSPLLRECWPLVTRALTLVHFRSDEKQELANGWHMLAKRDAYVRIVLQRCCLLISEWRWTMEGAEGTLARLFDIFNSHKLADLPTEKEHDFPAFLRDFDVEKLSTTTVVDGDAMQDPSFHLFIRLLGRAGQELRASAEDAKEGDRRISRLFSRMTPVRVMPFTRTDVPTSSQRSVLFNHYNVVMLFLYLVPASSPQRLRQIQSFLPAFKDADFVSQVTCIRAMMYVATIFRHHYLDLSPVTRWFGETISALRREYEEIECTTKQFERHQMQASLQDQRAQGSTRPDTIRMAAIFENAPARQAALRRKEELARLLVVALRSIQHIMRHGDLDGERPGPEGSAQRLLDHSLLSPAWTQQMLEAQISLEPRIGQEVLKCIQTFLLARIRVLQPPPTSTATVGPNDSSERSTITAAQPVQQPQNEESQDSFAELFEADDDFDFEDPMLARLLDEGDTSMDGLARESERQQQASRALATAAAATERKNWDREFADHVKNTISPSLFQLLSNIYHPDRRMEAAAIGSVVMSLGVTERLDEMIVDTHAGHNDGATRVATSRKRMDRLLKAAEARQYLELVVDCWAGCAHVLVTNGLREWSSYLGFGNESWKRIDDPIGRRDVGLRFLQNVLSLDAVAIQKREYEVEFLVVWIQTAVARVLSVQDVFTKSLMEAAMGSTNHTSLLSALATRWRTILSTTPSSDAVTDEASTAAHAEAEALILDLDTFTHHRRALLSTTYTTLASALTNTTTTTGTAYSILSALLSSLRAYVEDASRTGEASRSTLDYLRFCRGTLSDLESQLGGVSVMNTLKGEHGAVVRVVSARLAAVGQPVEGGS